MLTSPYRKPYITPPTDHPRLMLRKNDIPRIKENMSLPENAQAVEIIDELCSFSITGRGATPEYGTYNLREVLACEALSFKALLIGDAESAKKAIDSLMLLLGSFKVLKGNMGARWGGHLIFTSAQVYDWCYDFLSPEQKKSIIGKLHSSSTISTACAFSGRNIFSFILGISFFLSISLGCSFGGVIYGFL